MILAQQRLLPSIEKLENRTIEDWKESLVDTGGIITNRNGGVYLISEETYEDKSVLSIILNLEDGYAIYLVGYGNLTVEAMHDYIDNNICVELKEYLLSLVGNNRYSV